MENHYLYILYSPKHDKYYIGETNDILQRIQTHNSTDRNTFTAKYRPWEIVALFEIKNRSIARQCERFIKKQKSKKFIEKIVAGEVFSQEHILAQLVRVPMPRIRVNLRE